MSERAPFNRIQSMTTLNAELEARYQKRLAHLLTQHFHAKAFSPRMAQNFLDEYAEVHAKLMTFQGY